MSFITPAARAHFAEMMESTHTERVFVRSRGAFTAHSGGGSYEPREATEWVRFAPMGGSPIEQQIAGRFVGRHLEIVGVDADSIVALKSEIVRDGRSWEVVAHFPQSSISSEKQYVAARDEG